MVEKPSPAAFPGATLTSGGKSVDRASGSDEGLDESPVSALVRQLTESGTPDDGLFRKLVERSYDAILVVDGTARILYANPAAERVYGYSTAELRKLRILDIIAPDPESQAAAAAHFGRVVATGESRGEVRGLRKDGTCNWVDVNAVAVGGGCFLGTIRDTTERHELQEALTLSALVFDATSEAILVTDVSGMIVRVNRAFTEVTGYSAEEAIGQTPRILRSGHHDAAFYEAMWDGLARHGRWCGEVCNRAKDGRLYMESLSISAVPGPDGRPALYAAVFADITRRKAAEARLAHLASHDQLTGLPNRSMLLDRIQAALGRARRTGAGLAVMLLDLDDFKTVNDTLGHEAGDEVLQAVAGRLLRCVRESDVVARWGGDEFVCLLADCDGARMAAALAERVLHAVGTALALGDREIFMRASVGIAMFPHDGAAASELLRSADSAMYQAKAAGRNTWHFFHPEMHGWAQSRLQWETELHHALERGEFHLFFQPILGVSPGAPRSAEALLRWHHPTRGLISPAEFIDLAEETGFVVRIDDWVLGAVCRQVAAWRTAGLDDVVVAANVSPRQFRSPEFPGVVAGHLRAAGIPGCQLKLEITERAILHDDAQVHETLRELHNQGVAVVIDDFGTGYSSLSYLHRFAIDGLKIDRSFIQQLHKGGTEAGIVSAILSIARQLRMDVTAEGVETEFEEGFLRASGCSALQGYRISEPVPPERARSVIDSWPRRP